MATNAHIDMMMNFERFDSGAMHAFFWTFEHPNTYGLLDKYQIDSYSQVIAEFYPATKAIVINKQKYSQTTSRHQNLAIEAAKRLMIEQGYEIYYYHSWAGYQALKLEYPELFKSAELAVA